MKKNKTDLKKNIVSSDTFHVGIELELIAPENMDGSGTHDDDACYEHALESFTDQVNDMSTTELLTEYIGLSRDNARSVEPFINEDDLTRHIIDGCFHYECEGERYCNFYEKDHRDDVAHELKNLTGNTSFKVVSDGSIDCNDQRDHEVCWNYYASKDTLKDNVKILNYLKDQGYEFNKSCGLHINLNDYLKLYDKVNQSKINFATEQLDFLFNLVADSRKDSTYCKEYSVSSRAKYSMLYVQSDRVEFRFFSPTLNPIKLNHYVSLAHHVYKRLAGKQCYLNKNSETYFINKMIQTNGLTERDAINTMLRINSIVSIDEMIFELTGIKPKQLSSDELVA